AVGTGGWRPRAFEPRAGSRNEHPAAQAPVSVQVDVTTQRTVPTRRPASAKANVADSVRRSGRVTAAASARVPPPAPVIVSRARCPAAVAHTKPRWPRWKVTRHSERPGREVNARAAQ